MSDTTLSAKQHKALAALLVEPTIKAAADAIGVHERTLFTWLEDTEFIEAYRSARREAVQQAIARVQQTSSAAVQVLIDLMTSTSAPAAVRLNAAKTILDMSIKAVELEQIEQRLAALEARQQSNHALNIGRKLGQF